MSRDTCNARQPRGVWRCDLAPGHKGDHVAYDHEGPYASVRTSWPNERDKPKREPSPRSEGRTKRRSKGLESRKGFTYYPATMEGLRKAIAAGESWPKIETLVDQMLHKANREAMFYLYERLDPDGPHCSECGIPGDRKTLDVDHIKPRSKGGKSTIGNSRLLCNRFSPNGQNACHDQRHGTPQFTGTEG